MKTRTISQTEKTAILQRMNNPHGTGAPPAFVGQLDRAAINEEARTISYTASSETPVDRGWWVEILDHSPKAVIMDRMNPACKPPLLVVHDMNQQVGVILSCELNERTKKTCATARIGKSSQLQNEIWGDLVDEIRGSVSVGYEVLDVVLEEEKKNEPPVYRVTSWRPIEHSLVPIGADIKVGVGRSSPGRHAPAKEGDSDMDPSETPTLPTPEPTTRVAPVPVPPVHTITQTEDRAAKERSRVHDIVALGALWPTRGGPELAGEFVRGGGNLEEFRAVLLERLAAQPNAPIRPAAGPDISLTSNQETRFSIMRLLRAITLPDAKYQQEAAFELEVCETFQKQNQRVSSMGGMFIPGQVLRRQALNRAQDLLAGTASYGGETVQKTIMGDQFIELLRNNAVTMGMGRVISGLVGNVSFPAQTSGSTCYWVTENSAVTDSTLAFGALALSPKTCGTYVDISRQLLMQASVDVESLIMDDLTKVLGNGIDAVAIGPITGSAGSGEPSGFLTLPSGIGNEAWAGTDGCAPTWPLIVGMETTVAAGNAGGNWQFLTNPKVRGKLKKLMRVATYGDVPIWDDRNPATPLNGYPVVITNNVPSTITKASSGATLSAIIFGNFDDLVFGLWDGLEIARDTAAGFLAGTVRIRALQSIDLGLRHAASFTLTDEVITTG